MKVVTPKEMVRIEQLAYLKGQSSECFMENAGKQISHALHQEIPSSHLAKIIYILAGKGNNGGDAYVAGRYLLENGYQVIAYQLEDLQACNPLCRLNANRFIDKGGKCLKVWTEQNALAFEQGGLILDGIFGTGFKGKPTGLYKKVIRSANKSSLPIISIDIPSGLDGETGEVHEDAIQANLTFYLGLPKTGFFLNEGPNYTGRLYSIDFGLGFEEIEKASEAFHLLTPENLPRLPFVKRTRHKYEAGSIAAICGSKSMPGAAFLSCLSALRSGCGVVKLYHPENMSLHNCPLEIIPIPFSYQEENSIVYLQEELASSNVLLIGPGIGQSKETYQFLFSILGPLKISCVMDADALNLYSKAPFPLPENTLMTPHQGEMHRLLRLTTKHPLDIAFLKMCEKFTIERNISLVLKGASSFIFSPGCPTFVSQKGDPGMATAGAGDVLSGMIASLIAQGISIHQAAKLGVYLHGRSGEYAAGDKTSYCLIASDLIHYFPLAFKDILRISPLPHHV